MQRNPALVTPAPETGGHLVEEPLGAPRGTIALFIPSLGVGGAERQAIQLARGLVAAGWRVLLLTSTPAGPDCPGVAHVWTGDRKGFPLVARLASILRRERVDILQAYLLGSQVYALAAKILVRNVRLVVAVRASLDLNQVIGWTGKLSHALVFGLSPFVDQYVFNSVAGEFALGHSLPPGRRRVIFNGIDTTRFRPDAAAGAYVRATAGAPEGSRLVGIVANVNPHKGYETFVRAAAIVAAELQDVFFVAVGDYHNPMGARLHALVAELSLIPRFRFLGPRTDPERIVPGMDVVCSTSLTEGFSNAIGEAMACGVPCVVTSVGDSSLIVGETGIVVPPGDAQAVAGALLTLLGADPGERRRRGRLARNRILTSFGAQRVVEGFEDLYESMLRGADHSAGER